MEGVVPEDIACEREKLLAEQLMAAENALVRLNVCQDGHEATLQAVLNLVNSCGRGYQLSDHRGRRDYNQASLTA